MDDLTLGFAKEAAMRQIDDCTNIAELKLLAKNLVKSHFTARSFIATLLLRDISALPHQMGLNDELPWRQG